MVTTELLCTKDNMLALIPSSHTPLGKLPLSLQDMSSKPKFCLMMMMHILAKINVFRCFGKHQRDLYGKICFEFMLLWIQMNDIRHRNVKLCTLIHGFCVCIFPSHPKLKWEWEMGLNADYFSLSTGYIFLSSYILYFACS